MWSLFILSIWFKTSLAYGLKNDFPWGWSWWGEHRRSKSRDQLKAFHLISFILQHFLLLPHELSISALVVTLTALDRIRICCVDSMCYLTFFYVYLFITCLIYLWVLMCTDVSICIMGHMRVWRAEDTSQFCVPSRFWESNSSY